MEKFKSRCLKINKRDTVLSVCVAIGLNDLNNAILHW